MNSKEFFDNYWEQEGDKAITKLADKKYENENEQERDNDFFFLRKNINKIENKVNEIESLTDNTLDRICAYVGINFLFKIINIIILIYLLIKTRGL